MKQDVLQELKTVNEIIEKMKEQLADCKKDRATLDKLRETDGNNPDFIKAERANSEHYEEIMFTLKLLLERKESLLSSI